MVSRKDDGSDSSNRTGTRREQQASAAASRLTAVFPAYETTQAERAAMHPESHEVDWRYYHGAWGG